MNLWHAYNQLLHAILLLSSVMPMWNLKIYGYDLETLI